MITADLIELHEKWLRSRGLSERTIDSRTGVLRRWAGRAFTADDLTGWLATKGWAQETRASYARHLRGYGKWALERGEPDGVILAGLIAPKVVRGLPRPVEDDELSQALRQANPMWRLIITLAAYGGLRRGEICELKRSDVSAREIRIRGKGNRVRVVPTHPRVWAIVEPLGPGLVVTTRVGGPFSPRNMGVTFNQMCKRWGMPDITLHRFRHWFATTVYRNTHDILTLQQLLGHSTPATTAIYALVDSTSRTAAVASLPDVA